MEKLKPDHSYHIFNHANGFENIFMDDENYRFFLRKYDLYIRPVAETYAYCLLPNHFHLVVRIRKKEAIEANFSKVWNFGKVANLSDEQIEQLISKQFSKLFSCYTQSFNKVNRRMGSLFMKNFRRELINSREHFLSAVIYTHRNPVHHAFCERFEEWGYTSYNETVDNKSFITETNKLLKVFGGVDEFIEVHQRALEKFRELLVMDI